MPVGVHRLRRLPKGLSRTPCPPDQKISRQVPAKKTDGSGAGSSFVTPMTMLLW
jgi:hypothetical protein